ncbi:unnamed protein product [Allacma fusca]|uniref:CCHC-type domain-containing protein n=1 Tax=Allacma fusca TaxID=39272 RepID=A0A8J2LLN7_9HEXA|nr:unnamed protein product [Allacma fusca]
MESHIRALDTLGVTSEKCASMLYPLVESCLPEETLRAWQRHSQNIATGGPDKSKNRLTRVLEFLRSEVEGEERIQLARTGFGLGTKRERVPKEKDVPEIIPTAAGLLNHENQNSPKSPKCIFCSKRHTSQDCFQAQTMTLPEKKNEVVKKKGCFSCLKVGHLSKDCKVQLRCLLCSQKHFPVMCPELPRKKEITAVSHKENDSTIKPSLANLSHSPEVLLKTLIVSINIGGKSRPVRVLIDDVSHRSYILRSIAEDMKLNPVGSEAMIHALFGGVNSEPVEHIRYDVPVAKLDGTYHCSLHLLDQEKICSAVPKVPRGPWLGELKQRKIWISDVGNENSNVDILIGADLAGKLMTGQVKHLKSGLVAIETKLGWTLMGQLPGKTRSEVCSLVVSSLMSCDASISNLWSLEAIGINDPTETSSRAELELAAKEHFLRTVRVNEEGRYEVHLPWVEGHPKLGINRDIAEKRLLATTAKLKAGGRFEDYAKVFQEWLSSGVIEVVPDDGADEVAHYLPHRAVFKESSSTTKVRPVFDASAHAKGFPSLNDCLEKGPNLIEQILVILIAFREKRIGVVSDIAKAFLQLSVTSRDRNFLRFLWWENSLAKKIRAYRHRRVVFGVSSSPFLLGAVLEHHLCIAPVHLKRTAELLHRSFYVDNCVSCVDDQDELAMFIQESQELLEMGKFDLRGWEFTLPGDTVAVDQIQDVPVLGLLWNKLDDTLRCDVKGTGQTEALVTKRKILSVTHQVFDPLGILCPVTLQPKRLLQATWKSKSAWDTELPREITETFVKWAEEIHLLNEIRIPRWLIGSSSSRNSWSLHTFSDASKAAYAACVFLRAKTERGIVTQLVLAKSRVAPIKNVSIPRLELLSCVMGTRLANVVMDCLNLHDSPRFYWTDSSTALSWIKRDDQWATFVGNRVNEIRSSTSVDQWKHVPGNLNPADLPSRGCTSRQLLNSRWWEGPVWLKASPNEWPVSHLNCDEQEVNKEKRKTVSSLLAATTGWGVISKHFEDLNVYDKIVRRIAWLSRFSLWIRKKKNHYESSCLTVDELDGAEKKLLLAVQKEAFNPKLDFSKGVAVAQELKEATSTVIFTSSINRLHLHRIGTCKKILCLKRRQNELLAIYHLCELTFHDPMNYAANIKD